MQDRAASSDDHVLGFDDRAERGNLTDIFYDENENADRARARVLSHLKDAIASTRRSAEKELLDDGNGRRCASRLSAFQDKLIELIFDYTTTHVYRANNPSDAERMAIVATGGYGRGLLAPGSDIDLLFLLPYKQTAWGESVVEYVLYFLWDLGLKVGHATRNVDQAINLATSDMTIRTSVLDARLIFGDEVLFNELTQRFHNEVIHGSGREFVAAKLAERDERHSRSGTSRYVVEPNIKDGKGGMRDLHTLHWLTRYLHDAEPAAQESVATGVFTPEEAQSFVRCEDFLWTIRCNLHFLAGRAEERISFELQEEMAERLGYTGHGGLRSVERFMKHYFLIAKEVGDLTRVVCAELEMKQLKSAPALDRILAPLTWRRRVQLKRHTDFRIDNGRINIESSEIFRRDRVNIIRLFAEAEKLNVGFHPKALRAVRQSYRLIDDSLRNDPYANQIFVDLLTSKASAESVLRKMNEAGILGRFIPDFGRVVAMMQFNMYHHFTVDEHLIRAVGILSDIDHGRHQEDLPLSTEIIPHIRNKRALYVAVFLHDIAKGRDEDHAIAGARVARELCPRFGLSDNETELVAWLIEYHLLMSECAQSRDLADPKTIRDFAEIVQTTERLRLLLILTVADIRAVGPGVWNGWKGQLLRTLYYETELILAGGHTQVSRKDRVAEAQERFREALQDWAEEDVQAVIDQHYDTYWLRTEADRQIADARLLRYAEKKELAFATDYTTDAFTASTELTILTPNHPNLLASMAGACSASGANIVGANIYTTRTGIALDTFLIQREFERDDDELRRIGRIADTIEQLLRGKTYLDQIVPGNAAPAGRARAFTVPPEVHVDNTISDSYTVIEVEGIDRPGLLHDLTRTLSALNLDINSAHICTYGEKIVDVFYVTDLMGKKIMDDSRRESIRNAMLPILDPSVSTDATSPTPALLAKA
ncbi:MAG: [protein-PII] uridylyltransferase [Hyphomicrobiaceae bacterium]